LNAPHILVTEASGLVGSTLTNAFRIQAYAMQNCDRNVHTFNFTHISNVTRAILVLMLYLFVGLRGKPSKPLPKEV